MIRRSIALSIITLILVLPSRRLLAESANKISRIRIVYTNKAPRLPGRAFDIGVISYFPSGDSSLTRGMLGGSERWGKFSVEVEGGKFFGGKVYIDQNIGSSHEAQLTIRVRMKKNADISTYDIINLNYPVQLSLFVSGALYKSPGRSIETGLETILDNGTKINTLLGPYKRYLEQQTWLEAEGGKVKGSRIRLYNSPLDFIDHKVRLYAFTRLNPYIADSLEFLLDYKDKFRAVFMGASGMSGFSGSAGSSGSTGGSGVHGSDGCNGDDGRRGPNLEVIADSYFDTLLDKTLLKVWVFKAGSDDEQFFLVDPEEGELRIVSYGGDGGSGGSGGSGGTGGNGHPGGEKRWTEKKDGTYEEKVGRERGGDGGHGGDGGNGGYGGQGGNGGDISVTLSTSAVAYKHCLQVVSRGGDGGSGGSGGGSGSGGSGGQGDPQGRSGSSGNSGSSGGRGSNGYPGYVSFIELTTQYLNYDEE